MDSCGNEQGYDTHVFFVIRTHTHTNVSGQGGFGRGIETRGEHDLRTSYGRFDSETVLHFVYGRERSVTWFRWIFPELEQGRNADGGTLSTSSGDGSYSSQIVSSRGGGRCVSSKLICFLLSSVSYSQNKQRKIKYIRYIQSKEAAAKHILKDLVEMSKGVQHPMRALFLRDFINTQTRNLLPDVGNDYSGEGGTVFDSIDFTLQNFTQMNNFGCACKVFDSVEKEANR